MKISGWIAALTLAGCASPQPTYTALDAQAPPSAVAFRAQTGSGAAAASATLVQLDAPDPHVWAMDEDGNATHRLSGAICYREWAGLARARIEVFKPDGTDVGCNYSNPGSGRFLTFYVFKGDLKAEMASAVSTIKTRQPLAKETGFGLGPQSRGYQGAAFAYKDALGGAVRTSVLFTQAGGWLLEIRLTCPAEGGPQNEEQAGVALLGQADRLGVAPPGGPPIKPIDRT